MLLYIIFFVTGSLAVDSLIPDLPSEPGMVSPELGLLIMGALNAILIIALLESSRYRGWKLAFGLAFAYYMKYLQVQKYPPQGDVCCTRIVHGYAPGSSGWVAGNYCPDISFCSSFLYLGKKKEKKK